MSIDNAAADGSLLAIVNDIDFYDAWTRCRHEGRDADMAPEVRTRILSRVNRLPWIQDVGNSVRRLSAQDDGLLRFPGTITHREQRKRADELVPKAQPMDWAYLAKRKPPDRAWALSRWIGMCAPTLLVGAGGAGKTLLMLQLGACLSLGHRFIDDIPQAQRVLMWCTEDDHNELWRRMVDVACWIHADLEDFLGRFILVPRIGLDNTLYTFEYGHPMWTPAFEELRLQAGDHDAQIVMLDNSAQLFGGNENDRYQVTTFVNGLMGAHRDRAVILAAHPSRGAGSVLIFTQN